MVRRDGGSAADRIDPTVPHPARRYNYLLGAKDNFAADRESARELEAAMPTVRLSAVENRWFLHRAVRYLAGQGIRQYPGPGLDLPRNPVDATRSLDA